MEDQETGLGKPQRQWAQIVARAWADADFKARLLADPVGVLKEAGVDVPDGLAICVAENSAETAYFVLPAPPSAVEGDECEARVSAGASSGMTDRCCF